MKQEVLMRLGLNCIHALLLDWLVYFAFSGKQRILGTDEKGRQYYWVRYQKLLDDLPTVPIRSTRAIAKYMLELCGNGEESYPLIKKEFKSRDGTFIGFAINGKVLDELKGIRSGDIKKGLKKDKFQLTAAKPTIERRHRIPAPVMGIISDILTIDKGNGDRVFGTRQPKSDIEYTKQVKRFSDKLMSLYTGRFLIEYKVSPQFIKRNNSLIRDMTYSVLKKCKGNWETIHDVLVGAAENYTTWFETCNEPENKDWLPRNISDWLYSEHSGTSLFLACILEGQFNMRELTAERIFNSLPNSITNAAYPYCKNEWDGAAYWSRIKSVYNWYSKYAPLIHSSDPNFSYWDEGSASEWVKKYFEWLSSFTNGSILMANVGTNCRTWEAWLSYGKREHGITARLPAK
jgi:hypothetical protein